jgi:hypothetical protein
VRWNTDLQPARLWNVGWRVIIQILLNRIDFPCKLIALIAVAMSCSADGGEGKPVETSGVPQQITSGSPSVKDGDISGLPLAWYLVEASSQRELIHDAEAAEISKCMTAVGFDYVSPEYVPDLDFLGRRYGVAPEVAAQIGFQSIDLLDGVSDATENFAYLQALEDPAYQQALIGMETDSTRVEMADGNTLTFSGGCAGQARMSVYGSNDLAARFAEMDQVVQRIDLDANAFAMASEETQTALALWARCMHEHGFELQDAS